MKSKLLLLLPYLCILTTGCGGGFGVSRSTDLTTDESALLQQNWALAYRLAEYDRYAWIASDSILKYVDTPDSAHLQGWVVTTSNGATKVVFGRLHENCLKSAFEVSFEGTRVVSNPQPNASYCENDEAYVRFAAMSKAREANKADLDSANFPYNTYVLRNTDTLVVYLMPGSAEGRYGFCGGIRTLVDADRLTILENTKLHRSPLITSPPAGATTLMRTSSLGVVPNEVDLAQSIIFNDLASEHMITTSKYTFVISWDKRRKNVTTEVLRLGLEQFR